MSITDKELLTFCNLANLEMEYANIIKSISYTPVYNEKGEVTGQNENITNHTIYSLLENENISKENFEKLREKYEVNKKDKYIEIPEYSLEKLLDKDKKPISEGAARQIAQDVRTNAMLKEMKKEPEAYIGSFYELKKNNEKRNKYSKMSELRKEAPILMEYYDRYKVSKNKFSHEGKFLEEWEVIGAYDKYNLVKELYDNIQDSFNSNEKFLTREEIREKQNYELGMKIINIGYTVALNAVDCSSIFELKAFNNLKVIKYISPKNRIDDIMEVAANTAYGKKLQSSFKVLENEQVQDTVKGLPGILVLSTGNNDTIDKSFLSKMEEVAAATNIGNGKTPEGLSKSYLDLKDIFNFSYNNKEDDFKAVILRKKIGDKDEIVISISKKYFEDLNSKLNKSELPKNMKYILQLINRIQYNYETEKKKYNLTLTGIDEGGKVANILSTLTGCDVKGFFTNEPKNISTSVDFTERDLGFFAEELNYFPDITIEELASGAEFKGTLGVLENIVKEGSAYLPLLLSSVATFSNPYFLTIYSTFLLYKYLKNFVDLQEKNEVIEAIFDNLKNGKIIKNRLEKNVHYTKNYNGSYETENPWENNTIGGEVDLNIRDALKNNKKYVLSNGEDLNSYLMRIIFESSEKWKFINYIENFYFYRNTKEDRLVRININGGIKTYSRRKYWKVQRKRNCFGEIVESAKSPVIKVEEAPEGIINSYQNTYYEDIYCKYEIDEKDVPKGSINNLELMEELKILASTYSTKGKYYIEDKNEMQEEKAMYSHLVSALIFYGTFQETFKKRISDGKSYGAYMDDLVLKLEKKYSLKKARESKENKNEYIFFPFIQKKGELQYSIRDEYVGTAIRSAIYKNIKDDYKWKIDLTDENESNNEEVHRNLQINQRMIISNLKRLDFELKKSVIELIDTNGIDRYRKITKDPLRGFFINKLGIMRSDESYDVERIGYIYNDDDLRGRLIKIATNYNEIEEINKYFVYNGAKLKCSVGKGESRMIVDYQDIKVYESDYYATEEDCKPNINIFPFKSCPNCHGGKCEIENIEGKWLNNSNKSEIVNGSALLSSDSIMKCKKGGVISFANVKGVIGKS